MKKSLNCYCCYLQLTSRHASFNISNPKMAISTLTPSQTFINNLNLGPQIWPPPPYHSNNFTHFFPCLLYHQPSLHPHSLYCLWPKAYIHKTALSSKTTIPLVQDVVCTPHPKTSIYFIQPLRSPKLSWSNGLSQNNLHLHDQQARMHIYKQLHFFWLHLLQE